MDISDYTISLLKILEQAASLGERVTPNKLLDAWKGKGQTSLRMRSVTAPNLSQDASERLIVHLVFKGVLKEEFHFTPYSTICYLVKGTRAGMVMQGLKVKMDLLQDQNEENTKSKTKTKRKSKFNITTEASNGLDMNASSIKTLPSETGSKKRKTEKTNQAEQSLVVETKKTFVVVSDSDDNDDFV